MMWRVGVGPCHSSYDGITVNKKPRQLSGFLVSSSLILVEQITQTELHRVSREDAHVVAEGARDHLVLGGSQLEGRHHGTTRDQRILILRDEDGAVVDRLQFTPAWIQQVSEVEDIQGELQGVLGLTHSSEYILSEFHVNTVQPRNLGAIALSVLTAVSTQVFVLLDVRLKQITLCGLIVRNTVLRMANKLHLLQFGYRGDVDQVVSVHTIAVEVAVIGVGETSINTTIVI